MPIFMALLGSGHSSVVEHSTHIPKVEVSCPPMGNGKYMFMELLARGHSTVVEQSTHHPKVDGLCTAKVEW